MKTLLDLRPNASELSKYFYVIKDDNERRAMSHGEGSWSGKLEATTINQRTATDRAANITQSNSSEYSCITVRPKRLYTYTNVILENRMRHVVTLFLCNKHIPAQYALL